MIREDFMEREEVLKQDFEVWVGFDGQMAGGKNTRGRESSMSIALELTRNVVFLGGKGMDLFWKQEVSNIASHYFLL